MFNRSPSLESHRKPYIPSTAGNSNTRTSQFRPINQLPIEDSFPRKLDLDDWRKKADATKQAVLMEQIDRKVLGELMAQNQKLNELVRIQRVEIEQLKHRIDIEYRDHRQSSEMEKIHLVERLQKLQLQHQLDVQKLMAEITKLCEQCNIIESNKRLQLERLAEQFDRDMLGQLQQNKKIQDTNMEVYELQIKNLKQTIEDRAHEIQTIKHEQMMREMKLSEEIKSLESRLNHEQQMKQIQIRELRVQLDQENDGKVRNMQKINQISLANTESAVRKLRKQLADKILECEKLQNKMNKSSAENEEEIRILQSQKDRIRLELSVTENTFRDQMLRDKDRIKQLNEREIQTLIESNVCYTNSLKSQIQKLYEMAEIKTNQIQRLNHQLSGIKGLNKDEVTQLKKDITQLQKRLKQLELENKTEIETLKIKMGELHFNDVKGLEDIYAHNAQLLNKIVLLQDTHNRQNRERVHKELQQKELLRKGFEVEISKERSKCLDLKVKLAAASVQMKEQITSMASKMELTSQTLLRQTENKQKGAAFFEQQKRKLHQLIKAKDIQISGLQQNIQRLKQSTSDSDKNHLQQIGNLKSLISEIDESFKNQKTFYENQIDKLTKKNRQDKENLELQMEKSKNDLLKPLQQQIDELNRDKARLQKQLDNFNRQLKMAQQNLAMREGMYETIQLQSSAALEQEKHKIKILMNQNEVSLKQYFEEKVKSREKEIVALKEQLKQKDIDLRALISKYNQLQNKLSEVLKVHDRFSLLETKIMNLGMDNNLVKNLGELFKV